MPDEKPRNAFTDLLTRLVRVPKKEIDEQEDAYQASRKADKATAKPLEIVSAPRHS